MDPGNEEQELSTRRVLQPPRCSTWPRDTPGTWAEHPPAPPANPEISPTSEQDKDKTALNKKWALQSSFHFFPRNLEIIFTAPLEIHVYFNGLNHTWFMCHTAVKR